MIDLKTVNITLLERSESGENIKKMDIPETLPYNVLIQKLKHISDKNSTHLSINFIDLCEYRMREEHFAKLN
jgi:hypothetical protein